MKNLVALIFLVISCIAYGQEIVVCDNSNYTLTVTKEDCSTLWLARQQTSSDWDTLISWSLQDTCVVNNITATLVVQCLGDRDSNGQSDTVLLQAILRPFNAAVAGTIFADDTVCFGTSTTIGFLTSPLGVDDSYRFFWQTSFNGENFTDVVSADSLSSIFLTGSLDNTSYYRTHIVTGNGCSAYSNVVSVIVLDSLIPASIFCLHNQPICYGSIPNPINISAFAQGGDGLFTNQWQILNDGQWEDIVGATANSFQPAALTQTTSYRLKSMSQCGIVYSLPIAIEVYNQLSSATLTSATITPICYGAIPTTIDVATMPQGGDGIFFNQWQVLQSGQWLDIAGATANSYQPSALYQNTSYRLKSSSSCGIVYSQPYVVEVYNQEVPALITSNTTTPICYGTTPSEIVIGTLPQGGNGVFNNQWQILQNGLWEDIVDATANNYQPTLLYQTTSFRVKSEGLCGIVYSNPYTIQVFDQFVPGSIAGIDSICFNTASSAISLATPCMGGATPYTYQWQKLVNGVEWVDIAGQTTPQCNSGMLTATTQIRLKFTSSNGCGTVHSSANEIFVYPEMTPAVVASTNVMPLCYDSIPDALYMAEAPTGANGIFANQWQLNTGEGWEDIQGQTLNAYQPSNLHTTTQYRMVSTTSLGCEPMVSSPVTISVFDRIDAGQMIDQNICYQTTTTLSFAQQPSGGGDLYWYQWEESSDSVVFVPLSWVDTNFYNRPILNDDRYYRAIVTSQIGCSSDTTNVVKIHVYPNFETGVIFGFDTICYNTVPQMLTTTVNCQGGAPPYSYQWQVSSDGMNFTDIPDSNRTSFQPGQLTQATYYRMQFTSSSSCGSLFSNVVRVHVYDTLVKPTIAIQDTATLCFDSVPQRLFVQVYPTGGNGYFAYQWQENQGLGWSDIMNATAVNYQPQRLRDTISYRLVSTSSFGCGTVISDPLNINVYPRINSGVIGMDKTICYGDSDTISFVQLPRGGGELYSYLWQESLDGVAFDDIDENDTIFHAANGLIDATFYRVVVYSRLGCSKDTSNVVKITVRPDFKSGSLSTQLDSVCYGLQPQYQLSLASDCEGGAIPYHYQWQYSGDGVNFSDVPNATATYLTPDTLYSTTYYRVMFESAAGCGTRYSNAHEIKVNPLPMPHPIVGDSLVCGAQYATYVLPTATDDYSYYWSTTEGNGEIASLSPNNDSVEIFWDQPVTTDNIVVEVTDNVSLCSSSNYREVVTRPVFAPSRTVVVRKPHSNILICQEESPTLYYMWGYTIKATGQEVIIENSNRRYVLLPHDFDSTTYDYWVVLRPDKESPCSSRSYYDPSNDNYIEEPTAAQVIIPALANGIVPVKVVNDANGDVSLDVYSVSGVLQQHLALGNDSLIQYAVDGLKSGSLYIIRVLVGSEIFIQKTVVE